MKLPRLNTTNTINGHLYRGLTERLYDCIADCLPRVLFARLGRCFILPQLRGMR